MCGKCVQSECTEPALLYRREKEMTAKEADTFFHYEKTEAGGIRVLRVYGNSPAIEVPSRLEGIPITEVGAYCFADSDRAKRSEETLPGYVRELSGNYVEEISLPDTVEKMGELAFYNCTSLRTLQVGPALTEVGSDAFMNCFSLCRIVLRCGMKEKSGLQQILFQRTADTHVLFQSAGETVGELFYPEYYELHEEIGPAHIFSMNISGEGFRARQCFQEGAVHLAAYDRVFDRARAEESPITLCRMALYRLRYPLELTPEGKVAYESCLREYEQDMIREIIRQRERPWLEFLVEGMYLSAEGRAFALRLAAESQWSEGAAVLLEGQGKSGSRERYSLDGV